MANHSLQNNEYDFSHKMQHSIKRFDIKSKRVCKAKKIGLLVKFTAMEINRRLSSGNINFIQVVFIFTIIR